MTNATTINYYSHLTDISCEHGGIKEVNDHFMGATQNDPEAFRATPPAREKNCYLSAQIN